MKRRFADAVVVSVLSGAVGLAFGWTVAIVFVLVLGAIVGVIEGLRA